MTPVKLIYDLLDDEFAVAPANVHQTIFQLGLDSLDEVELVIRLEEALNIDLTDAHLDSTSTVQDLIDIATGAQANGSN